MITKKHIPKNKSKHKGRYKLSSIYSAPLDKYSVRIVKRNERGWGYSGMLYMDSWPADGGNTSHETAIENVFQNFRLWLQEKANKPTTSTVRAY